MTPAPRKRYAVVRAGAPKGPPIDPSARCWWVCERPRARPHLGRPTTRDQAFAELRRLLAHRDIDDPWREKLFVVGVPEGERPCALHASWERADPLLVQQELRARIARLGTKADRLCLRAGLARGALFRPLAGRGIRADTLALVRATLTLLEVQRGVRPRPVDLADEEDDDAPPPRRRAPVKAAASARDGARPMPHASRRPAESETVNTRPKTRRPAASGE